MSKLLSLKPWLSLVEAANYLEGIFNEQVALADVFRFCLSGHLIISANFVNHGRARLAKKLPISEAGFTVMPALEKSDPPRIILRLSERAMPEFEIWLKSNPHEAALLKERKESLFVCLRGGEVGGGECITRGGDVETIDGLWDLTMIGAERLDIEHALQQETGGASVDLICLDGVLLSRPDGTYARLQDEFTDEERPRKTFDINASPEDRRQEEQKRYFPAGRLPPDVPLVVRPEHLLKFVAVASRGPQSNDLSPQASEPVKPARLRADREENLLRVIAGLWQFSNLPPQPNTAADRLSALFDGWGWEKPTKGAMADLILTPASKINRIQK